MTMRFSNPLRAGLPAMLSGALLLAAPASGQQAPSPLPAPSPMPAPAASIQDPADSLYRAARLQMNTRRWADAARTLQLLRERHPRSTYVGDSYYFEALVRSRLGDQREVRRALELLAVQREDHPDAGTAADGRELMVTLQGRLAERGDARAARAVVSAARAEATAARAQAVAARAEVAARAQAATARARAEATARTQAGCENERDGVRALALSALLRTDPERARPLLVEVLTERDACSQELRERAVFILAQNPDDATVDVLVELARTDPSPEIREMAVFWLSQTEREEAVDALIDILESSETGAEVKEKAIFALGQHPSERAADAMRRYATEPGGDPEVRANAIFWLGQRGGVEATDFLRDLYTDLDDPELRERVLFAVAQSPDEAANLAWLTERALDEAEQLEVRKQALFFASQGGMEPAAVMRIFRTARDPELREQAVFALTRMPDSDEAVDALMEIARSEEDPELRERAVFWLGQSDDPRVAEFLLELIRRGGGGGG